jgi:lipid-A-disaccharide synthase
MVEAIEQLRTLKPEVQSIVVVAPSRTVDEVREITSSDIKLIERQTREALLASEAAAVASGTATLEAALLETPMVVVYKESPINWHTLGRLITVPHYGLVNLVAGKEIATELMQDDLTSENVVKELLKLLEPETNKQMRESLKDVSLKLGAAGASERAAELIVQSISVHPRP